MLRETKKEIMSGKASEKKEGWHYEFANKTIENWPNWKKAIYEASYLNKKEAVCK